MYIKYNLEILNTTKVLVHIEVTFESVTRRGEKNLDAEVPLICSKKKEKRSSGGHKKLAVESSKVNSRTECSLFQDLLFCEILPTKWPCRGKRVYT